MASFNDEQITQIREIAREERGRSWGRVVLWVIIGAAIFLIVLTYLASMTLQTSGPG